MDQITTNNAAFFLDQIKATRFRQGIRTLGQAADAFLANLQQKGARHNMLGSQLMQLLKDLRQQRMLSMDLAAALPAGEQFDTYIAALGQLRGTVARWLTVQAADPYIIEVEAKEFEMQCFCALGAGVMWLDSLHQNASMHDAQTAASVFGDSQAHGEDITDQVQHVWQDTPELQYETA